MKKVMVSIGIAALAMTSCSQDDTLEKNEGNGIRFTASVTKSTRANQSTLASLDTFKVTATGNSAVYFTDLKVFSTNSGVTWQTASTYYWPTYDLKFFAYAPKDVTGAAINSSSQTISFTPHVDPASQKDLVIAYNSGTKASNESVGVPLNFKHALSQIEVKAKCMNPNLKIEVLGVKVSKISSVSTFTFPNVETSASYTLPQGQWSTPTNMESYITKGSAPVILNATEQSIMFGDNNFMLIPQQLKAWTVGTTADGAYLSVLCKISSFNGNNYTLLYPFNSTKYAFSAVAINTNWDPGKKYTYVLEFAGTNSGGGYIDPDPSNPRLPLDPDVEKTPGITPTPGTGGTPILGKPIKFTVSVDDWTSVSPNPNVNM